MPFLAYPLALLGLTTVPALVAIYLMHNRFRRRPVSSLLLWRDQRRIRQGGSRVQRLRLPLLFFLELLILLLLTAAAAGPRRLALRVRRPLTVVLDDSASMSAASPDGSTSRDRASKKLHSLIRRHAITSVRIVLAGSRARGVGPTESVARLSSILARNWRCRAAGADLGASLALAAELRGKEERICVLTDHAPPPGVHVGKRLVWIAFGRPLPNVGIVQAVRSRGIGPDRCLIQGSNPGRKPIATTLTVRDVAAGRLLTRKRLRFGPRDTQTVRFELSPGVGTVTIEFGADALTLDNRVFLLPPRASRVRVRVDVRDVPLRQLVESALDAAGLRSPRDGPLRIEITDSTGIDAPESTVGTWRLRIAQSKTARPLVGPFVLDSLHPLTEGLNLDGVAWGASRGVRAPGMPVIMAGDIPLLLDLETNGNGHRFAMFFNSRQSTLQYTENWPILFWNLLAWRARELPGFQPRQVRLGQEIAFSGRIGEREVRITDPDGIPRTLPLSRGKAGVAFRPDAPGLYSGRTETVEDACACNLLAPKETDLSRCSSGQWGEWMTTELARAEMIGISWVFGLGALALLALHAFLIRRHIGRPAGAPGP